ncbi:MAG TPA: Gfo/Idh/MocA family oxidoreductase [Chloroflexota bacterium]|nr:Gfo/Idh/MocA family oxidoreductase [Chloroflexota bacterium]
MTNAHRSGRQLRAAMVGLQHGHMGSLDPAAPRGLLGTFRQLAEVEDVQIVAVCEPEDAAALAREVAFVPGARGYHSIAELLAAEEIDLAVVGLPAVEASASVSALAGHGVHCFVEKSVARTAAEFAPVVEAVRRTGAHVLVDYPWRHHPAMVAAGELLKSGALGRPTSILASMTTSQVGPLPGQRSPAGFAYRSETEGGGMLHWLGAHFLEAMCALLGDVQSVSAICAPVVGNMQADPRMDDVSSVSLLFENGAVGTLHTGYVNAVAPAAGQSRDFIRVWGTDGDAYWPALGTQLIVNSRRAGATGPSAQTHSFDLPEKKGVYGNKQWMFDLARSFVQGIRDGTPPAVGPMEAWHVLQIVDAAYESSRTRKWVDIVDA